MGTDCKSALSATRGTYLRDRGQQVREFLFGPPGALYNQYELHSMGQVLLDINCN